MGKMVLNEEQLVMLKNGDMGIYCSTKSIPGDV